MEQITFARWEIECDAATTRELFSRVLSGAPERCGCTHCVNLAAAREQVFSGEVLRLFEQLGIAPNREAEIYHTHRIRPGKHHYGGWFHFVGRIVRGSDATRQIGTAKAGAVWGFDLEKVGADFELGFTQRIGLLDKPLQGWPGIKVSRLSTACAPYSEIADLISPTASSSAPMTSATAPA
jgi:hypothetical protein